MRERFRGTATLEFQIEVVRCCVLAASTDADPAELVELAQSRLARDPFEWYPLYVLGIAHYRAGQHDLAARRLRESLTGKPDWPVRAISYPVLAWAHHRLGQAAEARQALDEAAQVLRPMDAGAVPRALGALGCPPGGRGELAHPWWDWVECQLLYREARVLIDGAPPPDDPRLHVLRARSYAGLRWNTEAEVEYAAALKLAPHDPQVRLEAHRNRAYSCVGRRQWSEAAAEFTRASELQPDEVELWKYRTVAHLGAGDDTPTGDRASPCWSASARRKILGPPVTSFFPALRHDAPRHEPAVPLARLPPRHFGQASVRSAFIAPAIATRPSALRGGGKNVSAPALTGPSWLAYHRRGQADPRDAVGRGGPLIDEANCRRRTI
jgi:Flp pilus assembly protein TadD